MSKSGTEADKSPHIPNCMRIVYKIESMIFSSELHADEALPSVRKMAYMSKTDHNTVQKAYNLLKEEKLIYARPGIGFFVSGDISGVRLLKREKLTEKLRKLVREAKADGFWTEDLFNIIDEVYTEK